jgi:hypothetical protein
MKQIQEYARKLLKQSFEGWTEEAIKGYRTAMLSVIHFIADSTPNETPDEKEQRIWNAYFEFEQKIHPSDKHEGLIYFKAGIEHQSKHHVTD